MTTQSDSYEKIPTETIIRSIIESLDEFNDVLRGYYEAELISIESYKETLKEEAEIVAENIMLIKLKDKADERNRNK